MKKQILILALLRICYITNAQQDPFLKDYLDRWKTSQEYMIQVAEAMPES